jgi:glucose/mannose transport system substrate-binding protein
MRTLLCTFSCALALGCSDAETADDSKLELLTWWQQRSELDAIDAVIAVHNQSHPDVEVTVNSSKSQGSMTTDVQTRLAEGTPPTAFQANLGGNALQWAESAQDLSSRAESWSGDFQASILERLTVEQQLIGVPLALTRQNNAYYNVALLDELGLDIPEGREELDAWLLELGELGYTHPLCMGDLNNWVSAHVLFEDIVPAFVGAQYSHDFWSGKLSATDALFAEALDYAATLNPYWNTDFDAIDMAPGITRVMEQLDPSEQCLMTPMGDWGGAILAADYEVDAEFAQRSWPGAEALFVLAGDAFVTTRGVRNQRAALDFFDTLASEAGQIAFNTVKGSVPARSLAEAQRREFGPLAQANMADLAAGDALPAYKVLGSSEFPWDDLAKLTHDFILVGDKQPIIDFIEQHYEKLAE